MIREILGESQHPDIRIPVDAMIKQIQQGVVLNGSEYYHILCSFVVSDDEAAGVGGTLLKYIKEGYNVIKVIFSSGEMSHPHYRKEVIVKERIDETIKISKKYGIKETIFFELEDAKLKENINNKIKIKIKDLIKKYDPFKVFIPSEHDPHVDHRAVYNSVLNVLKSIKYNKDIYSYEVWNVVKEDKPVVYVDITKNFKRKVKMMKEFRSQWHFMYPLLLPIYFRARYYGLKAGCKCAERFYKLK